MKKNVDMDAGDENLRSRTVYTTDEEWEFLERLAKKQFTNRTGLVRKYINEEMQKEAKEGQGRGGMDYIVLQIKYLLIKFLHTPYWGLITVLIINVLVINRWDAIKQKCVSIFRKKKQAEDQGRGLNGSTYTSCIQRQKYPPCFTQ